MHFICGKNWKPHLNTYEQIAQKECEYLAPVTEFLDSFTNKIPRILLIQES